MKNKALSTLPKWAQKEIQKLRGEVAHWKKLAHSATVDGASNVTLGDLLDSHGLPNDSRITFHCGPKGRIEVNHDRDNATTRSGIEVHTGDGRLIVRPGTSNMLYIEVDPR